MTIVPGMWYKLLHGNAPTITQLVLVSAAHDCWIFGTTIDYEVRYRDSSTGTFVVFQHGSCSKTNFEKSFEPASM